MNYLHTVLSEDKLFVRWQVSATSSGVQARFYSKRFFVRASVCATDFAYSGHIADKRFCCVHGRW
jgi:hypothetical protein